MQKATSQNQIQDRAATSFFRAAYRYAESLDRMSVLSASQVEEFKAPYAEAARQLLELAATLRSFGMSEAEELKKIATKVKDHWPDEPFHDIWVSHRVRTRNIENHHGDFGQLHNSQNLRRYVTQLAKESSRLFGSPLYGTVAAFANVAFELKRKHEITGEQVRQILRSPPIPLSG